MTAIRAYRNAFLIYNPNAGQLRRHPKLLTGSLSLLEEQGHRVTAIPTSSPKDATGIASGCVERGADLIIALGGDGTINEVANGMVGSEVPLAILPGGTANVLSMEVGLRGSALRAARRFNELEPARISVGVMTASEGRTRRHFLCMAGAGFDAAIVFELSPSMKNLLGKGAYWAAGFGSLTRRLAELRVTNGFHRKQCSFALASRVRNYGGDLEIALGASLLDKHFEVVLFEGDNALIYFKYLYGVLTRSTAQMEGVTVFRTDCLDFAPAAEKRVHIQVDGEDSGFLPARVEIVPDSLTLLLPKEFIERERKRVANP